MCNCRFFEFNVFRFRVVNRKHSRTECKNSLEMSILRGVFEGDINYDCIFTGFFAAPEAGGTASQIPGEPEIFGNRHSTLSK